MPGEHFTYSLPKAGITLYQHFHLIRGIHIGRVKATDKGGKSLALLSWQAEQITSQNIVGAAEVIQRGFIAQIITRAFWRTGIPFFDHRQTKNPGFFDTGFIHGLQ